MLPGPKVKVRIECVENSSDGLGGYTETWSKLIDISGTLTSPKGNEYRWEVFRAGKEVVRATHIFYCEKPTNVTITELCRLVYNSRYFDIVFVREPGFCGHHIELELVEIK
jgi:SPP1 family predicted phage head-tail adaptor